MQPLQFHWDGESFTPANQYWARKADQHYVVGERYGLVPHEDRSPASHRHYFACIREAWLNMPEQLCDEFQSPEHLRKKALIWTGYSDERSIVCTSKAEAERVASFIRPMDAYAIVQVREATVRVFTAQSQSQKAMGKKVFQESKDKVLDWIGQRLGVSVDDLRQTTREAA